MVLVFLEIWMRAMENAGGDKLRDLGVRRSQIAFPQRRREDPLAASRVLRKQVQLCKLRSGRGEKSQLTQAASILRNEP